MKNYIRMNDFNIRTFLIIVLSVQLAMIGSIALDITPLKVPLLRQLIGFIYTIFIPGMIILRILRLHNLGNIETILYSVGLSISFECFLGFFINEIYPLFGISNPISIWPLIITFSIVLILLCILCYVRDQNYSNSNVLDIGQSYVPLLFLCLIPFIAVIGAYSVNTYQNSAILKGLILVLSFTYIIVGFNKLIPIKLYAFAVFIISLSLLYHKSLISMSLWGTDIQNEYYYAHSVVLNGLWNLSDYGILNTMLSIVMLAPILSILLNTNLIWIFKIIYPFLFSLVPVGLYRIFQKQTSDIIAFFACAFFMSVHVFYSIILEVPRQQIAQLFLTLLLLLIVSHNIDKMQKKILAIIFSFAMITSHYGVSYIWMFTIIISWIIVKSVQNPTIRIKLNNLHFKHILKDNDQTLNNVLFKLNLSILYLVFILAWYLNISESSLFDALINVSDKFISQLSIDLINPNSVESLRIIASNISLFHEIAKYLHLCTLIMLSIGIALTLLGYIKEKINLEYFIFSSIFYIIAISSLLLPGTSVNIGTDRAYIIFLNILAPFFIIGFIYCFKLFSTITKSHSNQDGKNNFKILSIFLSIFLLFNSGFVYEIANDNPTSIALSPNIQSIKFNESEVYAASWLGSQTQTHVLAGDFGRFIIYNNIKHTNVNVIGNEISYIPSNYFIFLDSIMVKDNQLVISTRKSSGISREKVRFTDSMFYIKVVTISNKIYNNGGAYVYKTLK